MLDVTPFDVLQALGKHGVQEAERLAAHSLASVEIETVRILPSITGMPAAPLQVKSFSEKLKLLPGSIYVLLLRSSSGRRAAGP